MAISPIFSNSFDVSMKEHKRAIQQEKVKSWIARKKAYSVLSSMLGEDIEQ